MRLTPGAADPAMSLPDRSPGDGAVWAVRAGWCVAGMSLLWWGFDLTAYTDAHPWVGVVQVALTLGGLAVIVVSWMSPAGSPHPMAGWTAVAATLGAYALWSWLQLRGLPGYRTDEAAFDQYAAQLLVHGHDPYLHTLAPALSRFGVAVNETSRRLDGAIVTSLSYPALSFLVYAPLLALGWSTQLAPAVNVGAWMLTIALGYALVPRTVKPIMLVIGSLALYVSFGVVGVTDLIYLPVLMVAVYRWDRIPGRIGWRAWIAPVAMGLALAVKQTPWLVLPFVVIGLYLETVPGRPGARIAGRFLIGALATFLLVNLPFLIASPGAWADGVLMPLTAGLIPQGQGWIALSTVAGTGGGNLIAYTALLAAVLLLAAVMFVIGYPRTKPLAVLLPCVVYAFAARSQENYLVMLIPVALVAATTVNVGGGGPARWRAALWGSARRRWAVIVTGGLAAAALVLTLAWPPPLALRVTAASAARRGAPVGRIALTAHNDSGQTVRPVFLVRADGALTAPWRIIRGPSRLAAGQSAAYVLQAPDAAAAQPTGTTFRVVAATTSPPALSVSGPVTPH